MKKWILFLLILSLTLIGFNLASAQTGNNSYFCTLYFTFIGCPNCAHTDPIVLTEWPQKYPNLVVIEYGWRGGDLKDPNAQFFGNFAQKYKISSLGNALLGFE